MSNKADKSPHALTEQHPRDDVCGVLGLGSVNIKEEDPLQSFLCILFDTEIQLSA